ncbi:unnamed protein product [Effrenium voratum]|uniref:EF-hand domain-containing protein n=1 Tax=Effrenium voratum TaxID=2562239 RepID=A0AA36HX82_9DINO|nr:unnamed protein product [Effrenium voratum]
MQGCGGYYTGLEATWNWFDNACLLISLIDLVFSYIVVTQSSGGSEPFMLMRMLRLARLARLVRLMRFRMFRELKLMVLGLFSGLRALAWAIVLLMFTIYTVGVLMRLISDLPEFASMPNAMFTLFRCFVTDGCVAYDGTPLPEKLRSDLGVPFFVFYILTTMVIGVGLFNLIMAVFIDNVLKSQGQRKLKEIGDTSAAVCTELKLQFRRFLCEPTVASHRTLFSRLSESAQQKLSSLTDESFYRDQASRRKIAEATYRILQEDKVSISRDMFMMWLQDPEFTTMLEEADVDMSDKFRMFDILDVDMGGELSADELVTGLMQLRGDVSKGDIVAIMLKVRHLTYAIDEVQKSLKLGRLDARVRDMRVEQPDRISLPGGREGTGTRLAAEALHSQGPLAAEHTTTLSSALLDVDEDVRELAALTLLATGEASLPCQRRLMRTALNDNASHVQAAAICVLELLSGQLAAADFAAELAAALESDRVSARWGALKALQALGADAVEPYAHQLALLLSDDSWFVRSLATELLLELGPRGAENSQPVLVKALHNLDQEVRRTAAIALGKHGQVASCRASALCTRMLANRPGVKSNDPEVDLSERLDVKTACMWALGQLHPDSVVPLLHHLDDGLFHRNSEYRLAATEALHNLGPAAVELRKDQLGTMASTDRDDRVREAAAVALKHLGL